MTAAIAVQIEGGWHSHSADDDALEVEIIDPHTASVMMTITIPASRLLDVMRNRRTHKAREDLGRLEVRPVALSNYGNERHIATILIPRWPSDRTTITWAQYVRQQCPAGWDHHEGERPNMHRLTDERPSKYRLNIARSVPPGTDPVVEGHPDAEVRVIDYIRRPDDTH